MPIFRVVVESQIVILQPRGCFPLQEIKAIWLSKKKQSVTFYEVILVVTNIMIIQQAKTLCDQPHLPW